MSHRQANIRKAQSAAVVIKRQRRNEKELLVTAKQLMRVLPTEVVHLNESSTSVVSSDVLVDVVGRCLQQMKVIGFRHVKIDRTGVSELYDPSKDSIAFLKQEHMSRKLRKSRKQLRAHTHVKAALSWLVSRSMRKRVAKKAKLELAASS